jgi:hypothetical protein
MDQIKPQLTSLEAQSVQLTRLDLDLLQMLETECKETLVSTVNVAPDCTVQKHRQEEKFDTASNLEGDENGAADKNILEEECLDQEGRFAKDSIEMSENHEASCNLLDPEEAVNSDIANQCLDNKNDKNSASSDTTTVFLESKSTYNNFIGNTEEILLVASTIESLENAITEMIFSGVTKSCNNISSQI